MGSEVSQFRRIIRGFFSLTIAKLFFMVAGYAVYFTLPRLLSTAEFGNYGVVVGLLNIFNMVLITGTIQAVSKFVSEKEEMERAIRKSANKIQVIIGGAVFLILFLGAPLFAVFFKDSSIIPAIRVGAFVPFFYAFYAVAVGSLNGRKMFTHQACLDMSFATMKAIAILSLAALGYGVVGAFSGFSTAALVVLSISLYIVYRNQTEILAETFPIRRILTFEIWVMITIFLNNLLLSTDLFMVKSLLEKANASIQAGYYTAVLSFGRIPFTLVMAVSLVIFPLISKSTFENDSIRTKKYIQTSLRLTFLLVLPIAIIFSAMPVDFLTFVYPADYVKGSGALYILPLGEAMLALMFIAVTMIIGSGHPKISIMITAATLVVDILLCYILIPKFGITGAALSSSIAWTLGFIFTAVYLNRKFQAFVPAATWVRSVVAGTAAFFAGYMLPGSGLLKILEGSVLISVVFIVSLFLTKEVTLKELKEFSASFKKK